jgi:hypothetical protein
MTSLIKIVEEKSNLQLSQELVQKIKSNHNIKIQFFGEGLPLPSEERKHEQHKK